MRTRIKFYSGKIVSSVADGGPWHVESRDPEVLRHALGDELLLPFAELFVWTDRLASIAQLLYLNSVHVPQRSVSSARNQITLVAYAVGALYEAAHAIRRLRQAGVAGLVPHSEHWKHLDALRKRWQSTLPLQNLRNQIAFHADEGKISDGLERFIRKRRRLPMIRGDSPKKMHSHHALGPELLLAGLRYTRRDLRRASAQIAADHVALGDLVEQLLIEVMRAKGLMVPV